jgi:hypothetical protein
VERTLIDASQWQYLKTIQRPGDKSDTVNIYERIKPPPHD